MSKIIDTIKTFHEYSVWTDETAIYPVDKQFVYLPLKLFGETGELMDKYAKRIREPIKNQELYEEGLIAELGDIAYYIARLYKIDDDSYTYALDNCEMLLFKTQTYSIVECLFEIGDRAQHLYYTKTIDSLSGAYLLFFWIQACNHLNINPLRVLEANRTKLESRKNRGVITGSGDNR